MNNLHFTVAFQFNYLIFLLQVLCENIFIDRFRNLYNGLLHNPPGHLRMDINDLINQCAYPLGVKDEHVRHKSSTIINNKLLKVLKDSQYIII